MNGLTSGSTQQAGTEFIALKSSTSHHFGGELDLGSRPARLRNSARVLAAEVRGILSNTLGVVPPGRPPSPRAARSPAGSRLTPAVAHRCASAEETQHQSRRRSNRTDTARRLCHYVG
jgi:hypothetical protein